MEGRMTRSEDRWLSTIGALHAAAAGLRPWENALRGLAAVTGSQSSQLIGLDSDRSAPVRIIGDSDGAAHRLEAARPTRAGSGLTPRAWMESPDRGAKNCRRDPLYRQMMSPGDRPFVFLKTLEVLDGTTISLLATRSARDGRITASQRRVFATLVPHARAAIRIQLGLEQHATESLIQTLELLDVPAFIVTSGGALSAATAGAQSLLTGRSDLKIVAGHLRLVRPADAKALAQAVQSAVRSDADRAAVPQTVIVRSVGSGVPPLILSVLPIPSMPGRLRLAPRIMIVVRGRHVASPGRTSILTALYGLSAAEAAIAEQLALGVRPAAIAAERRVTVGTVRAQIKALMAKIGVSRQFELSARLSQI